MNWRKLSTFIQYLLNFPTCIFIFICCAGATIGLLYLRTPFDIGLQYLPAIASAMYFSSRSLYALNNGLSITANEILGYSFIASTALSVALQLYLQLDATDRDGLSALDYTVAMWVFNAFYFFAGAACTRTVYRKSDIIAIVLVLLVLIPYLSAPKQGLFLDYWIMRQETGIDRFTHLVISEWCVFLFVGAFAFASDKLRPFIIITAALVLFGLQGRSSTIFTVFTLLSFWVLTGGKKVVLIYGGLIIVAIIAMTFLPIGATLLGADDRALDRMMVGEGDSSLEGRASIFWASLQHLPSSILYGDPTYIAYEAGSMGSYIHNILSMWQFFGLLPFVLIMIILFRGALAVTKRIRQRNLSVMEEFACMLFIYAGISVVLSKSVVFYWLWFSAGYWMLQYSGSEQTAKPRRSRRKSSRKRRSRRSKSDGLPTRDFRF